MRWITIPDVIAHSGLQCKGPAVSQARFQFAFKTQKYMPLGAPVIRLIPRRIFDHAHTNLAEILRSPQRFPRITSMFGNRNFTPVGYRESRGGHFHVLSIASTRTLVCPAGNTRTTSIQIPRCQSTWICVTLFLRLSLRLCCAVPRLFVNASSENPRLQFPPYVISVIQN
jgi:hypothetical protein